MQPHVSPAPCNEFPQLNLNGSSSTSLVFLSTSSRKDHFLCTSKSHTYISDIQYNQATLKYYQFYFNNTFYMHHLHHRSILPLSLPFKSLPFVLWETKNLGNIRWKTRENMYANYWNASKNGTDRKIKEFHVNHQ